MKNSRVRIVTVGVSKGNGNNWIAILSLVIATIALLWNVLNFWIPYVEDALILEDGNILLETCMVSKDGDQYRFHMNYPIAVTNNGRNTFTIAKFTHHLEGQLSRSLTEDQEWYGADNLSVDFPRSIKDGVSEKYFVHIDHLVDQRAGIALEKSGALNKKTPYVVLLTEIDGLDIDLFGNELVEVNEKNSIRNLIKNPKNMNGVLDVRLETGRQKEFTKRIIINGGDVSTP